MGGHEVDGLRCGHLGWNDQVALIFPVFIIDKDEHAAITGVFNDVFNF